jgi:hypothetical protein
MQLRRDLADDAAGLVILAIAGYLDKGAAAVRPEHPDRIAFVADDSWDADAFPPSHQHAAAAFLIAVRDLDHAGVTDPIDRQQVRAACFERLAVGGQFPTLEVLRIFLEHAHTIGDLAAKGKVQCMFKQRGPLGAVVAGGRLHSSCRSLFTARRPAVLL